MYQMWNWKHDKGFLARESTQKLTNECKQCKTGELDGSIYVKIPLRSSIILNFEMMINIAYSGQFKLIHLLVKVIILSDCQIIENFSMS